MEKVRINYQWEPDKTRAAYSVTVHDGVFHAHDVAVVALLLAFDYSVKVNRTRDINKLQEDYNNGSWIVDVGGVMAPSLGLLDHHVIDKDTLPELHQMFILPTECVPTFYPQLIETLKSIILIDHGLATTDTDNSISKLVGLLNPTWRSKENRDEAFMFAAEAVAKVFMGLIERDRNDNILDKAVKQIPKDEAIIEVDTYMPLIRRLELHSKEHKFFVSPTLNGTWSIQTLSDPVPGLKFGKPRIPIKEEIITSDPELAKNLVFHHKGEFFTVFQHKEDAVKAAKLLIEKTE